jgi:predicted class III extradiol MEMO1 family dioxygenase
LEIEKATGGIPKHHPDDVPDNPGGKQAGTVEYCGEADAPESFLGERPIWDDVCDRFVEATVLNQIESRHVIMVLPVAPVKDGGVIVAQAFKALPRKPVNYLTSMTKVVLVGHSYVDGNDGITVGAEACRADLVDTKAARWFKKNTMNPMVLSRIDSPDCCPTHVNPTIDQQMPYLSVIFDEPDPDDPQKKIRTLKGNLLPIMIQKQSVDIGNALGEALTSLIGPTGIWNKEKVLFVFTSDMSHGIKKKFALPIDKALVNTIINQGFGPTVNMVNEEKAHDENPGSPEDFITHAPFGYSCVLAATKLAENLSYRGAPMAVTSSGAYEGAILTNGLDPVRGYATIVWVGDEQTEGEKIGTAVEQVTVAPEKSTTTTKAIHPGEQQYSQAKTDAPKLVGAAPYPSAALISANITKTGLRKKAKDKALSYLNHRGSL